MAQVVLGAVGKAVGGGVGGAIGSALGAMADRSLIEILRPARQVGSRLDGIRLAGVAEGAPMAAVFGRARVSGQVIWAARFRERREEGRSGGGKGGPRTTDYRYSLSFAVALCEGPIDGVGRVWADGAPMDMPGVTMRVHRGLPDQAPDPLIEAVEGEAPAYRGTAYVVFEGLALEAYGDRPPQLSFEVFRRPAGSEPALEDRLTGVCLIPGAGEFVYATDAVLRREGIARYAAETVNNTDGRADLVVSLDQLQAQLPNVRRVSLVVAWFGDDLRCGHCQVRPGVESLDKATTPWSWRAGGVDRSGARLITGAPEVPAFGGTPADRAVLQATAELKARGLEVTLYPLMMMDVPEGNGLPDPYGGDEQAAFPWRGRITCHPAAGQVGSPDGTEVVEAQVAAFFGTAGTADFGVAEGLPNYAGPDEWSYRRMVLHCAKLVALAGGVDGFLIGSELRGLTTVRGSGGSYPAVEALRALAADVRAIIGDAPGVSYGADWSEWVGHQPADGSRDVAFHLDPLWADPAISYVGIDWYPPLSDWRSGDGGLDAAVAPGPHDRGYLLSRVAGGEGFDWFYADAEAREAQARAPITDGAYGEPWVFRPKDLVGWWSQPHHDRPGGVRSETPTAWAPGLKPIRFTEFGCPAVDRGANAPNLFFDGRSSESALPPDSDGSRDDLMQRRALEATLEWFAEPANNPVSEAYGGPMLEAADAWCWDARPFPDFPARSATWADAPSWARGHWLTGRLGGGEAAALVRAVLERGGLEAEDYDLSGLSGSVSGYVIDQPMRVRDALEPLATAFGFEPCERDGRVAFAPVDGGGASVRVLSADDLAMPEEAAAPAEARVLESAPEAVRLRFLDAAGDYQAAEVLARSELGGGGGLRELALPVVMERGQALAIAEAALTDPWRETATAALGPEAALRLEPGDLVEADGYAGVWRVSEVRHDEQPTALLVRPGGSRLDSSVPTDWRVREARRPAGPALFHLIDAPPLPGAEADARPLAVAAAEPWRVLDLWSGPSAEAMTRRGTMAGPTTLGVTTTALSPGPLWRWDRRSTLEVRLQGESLQSRTEGEVAAGRNTLAVMTPAGEWELLSFANAELIGEERWRLSTLLRGRWGSEGAITATPAGAPVVLLDSGGVRVDAAADERGLPRVWRAAPAGGPPGGTAASEVTFTWRGLAHRPWAAAHLRVRSRSSGDLAVSWVRRARMFGDSLETEPPLVEAFERWRVRVLDPADEVMREAEVATAAWIYSPADQAADFAGSPPFGARVEVTQGSASFGWGVAASAPLA